MSQGLPSTMPCAAIVVTSIAAPNQVMRELAAGALERGSSFIVIGDVPSPADFQLDGCEFFSVLRQEQTGLKTAALSPRRHYARKNIGSYPRRPGRRGDHRRDRRRQYPRPGLLGAPEPAGRALPSCAMPGGSTPMRISRMKTSGRVGCRWMRFNPSHLRSTLFKFRKPIAPFSRALQTRIRTWMRFIA